ncbi:MAG: alpha/beta hydrolase [Rubrivivax sp.]|nr:alpha/beta hydrolase [Rubrivivax sp.]
MSAKPASGETWTAWEAVALRLAARFEPLAERGGFEYRQPPALQRAVPRRHRREYGVPVHWTCWGPTHGPRLLCVGGVVSSAARFSFVAADLARAGWRVVCMDWVGRGRSGWLADETEYALPVLVEQLRQAVMTLGGGPVALLGSSMGASAAIALAAREPGMVSRLVLNDTGPYLPRARRQRRAEVLARWYVFRTPAEIMRRVGASQKNDGPVSDEVRHFLAWQTTRWSDADAGRVYRHDPRALLAYRRDAQQALSQWDDWARVRCPVMLLHGMASDALSAATIARMRRGHELTVAHVPATGHTPVLDDRHQTATIAGWLADPAPEPAEYSLLPAPPRVAAR